MNAADVLRDMVRQYAAFDSYRDTGFVTTTFFASDVVNRISPQSTSQFHDPRAANDHGRADPAATAALAWMARSIR